jgi:uncharacterized membrane protein YtjA (UPF0391 family)
MSLALTVGTVMLVVALITAALGFLADRTG